MKTFWNFDFLNITQIVFWILTVLIILSFLSLIALSFPSDLYLEEKGLIKLSNDTNSGTIYSVGLSFLFIIISLFSAVMIFLIQHINSTYNTEELKTPPIFLKDFLVISFTLLFYIFFNLFALYFKLGPRYEIMSFIFSLHLVVLIPITIIFVYYNTRVSIVLGIISKDILNFIRKNKKFENFFASPVSYSEEFVKNLNKKTEILIKNAKRAINNDQDVIFRNSLKNLRKICREYLEQSKHIIPLEDKFLNELNDQFNFIITASLKSSNQKILEDIAETMGAISADIIEYRKEINFNTFVPNWIAALKDLFLKSYHKDRTTVCHTCLDQINKIALLALDKDYYNSYEDCTISIDEIANTLLKKNERWGAALLQHTLVMYEKQFLKFLDLLKEDKDIIPRYFIPEFFKKIAKIINQAKISHAKSNLRVIFASLYGVNSFAQEIAKTDLSNIPNSKKRQLFIHIREFINFNNEIIRTIPEENDSRVYNSFSESLFLLNKRIDLEENDKKSLIKTLSKNLVECIKNTYCEGLKNYVSFKPNIIDYLAILIYLNHEKTEIIKEVMQNLVGLYNEINKQWGNENRSKLCGSLYQELKLYSCWINTYPELKDVNKPLIDVLIADFYKPVIEKGYAPLFREYGYPDISLDHFWSLQPSNMWGGEFISEVSEKLNGPEGENYIKFHEVLKSKRDSQKRR